MKLRDAILAVQSLGPQYGFTIVIVGGAAVRLIGAKTTIQKIDTAKREIILKNAESPSTTRTEDARTTVDIDCIAFTNEKDPFTQEVKESFFKLKQALKALQKQTGFPAISLEPVLYHPYFPKPNPLAQFVSSIESYHDHDFFFRLGSVKQDVKRSSLAFWTYVLSDDQKIVSFNPLALQLRYSVRGFAAKPKDLEKIWGKSPFARFVQEFNEKTKSEFVKDFSEWDLFIQHVAHTTQPSMQIKRLLWKTYWQTVGTYLAHGTGFIGKILLPLGNTFFAGK